MILDPSNPINLAHPDNAGLRLCLLAHPSFTGGQFWLDAMGQNLGSALTLGSAGALPNWQANRVSIGSGNYIATPLSNFTGSGTVIWEMTPATSYNDGSIRGIWGQTNVISVPEFTAQKYSDNNFYIGWNGVSGDQRVTLTATAYQAGVPVRYAFTWVNGGVSKLYANGLQIGANGGTTNTTNIGFNWNYGRQGSLGNGLGLFGELRIYNQSLSADAVARDYEWWRVPERDPRLNYIQRRFWSTAAVTPITTFTPAFQPSFWGVA